MDQKYLEHDLSTLRGTAWEARDFDWLEKSVPCQYACPAKTDVPAYLGAIAEGDFTRVYRINLADNVFPAVLGRICSCPCEPVCRHGRDRLGEPLAICFSKRSASDFHAWNEPVILAPIFPATGKKSPS